VDAVWNEWPEPRPSAPKNPVCLMEHKYSGMHAQEKFEKVKEALKDKEVDELLITTLDDIMWLLNMRGTDIQCNPVFFSYVVFNVADMKVKLFMDADKNDEKVKAYLAEL